MVEVEAPSPALSSRWNLRGSWLVEVVLDVLPNTGLLPALMSLSIDCLVGVLNGAFLVGLPLLLSTFC